MNAFNYVQNHIIHYCPLLYIYVIKLGKALNSVPTVSNNNSNAMILNYADALVYSALKITWISADLLSFYEFYYMQINLNFPRSILVPIIQD